MGFLPQRRAGGSRRLPPTAPPPEPSTFFKLIEHLNRLSSASLGMVAGGLQGGVGGAVEGGVRGFKDVDRGGREVISALTGADPESKLARRAGLAVDIVNPLDPLNFIGIGGLTKAGRAARLASKVPGINASARLAGTFSQQAKAGQRGLLTFAGKRVPIPGDAAALQGIENTRRAIAQSKYGKAIQKNFGGVRGAVLGTLDDPVDRMIGEIILDAQGRVKGASRRFAGETEPLLQKLSALSREENEQLGDLISRVNRNDLDINDARVQFIGSDGRAAKRKAAFEAAEELQPLLKDFAGSLEGTGLDQYLSKELGFLPRVIRPLQDMPRRKDLDDFLGLDPLTGEMIRPTGQSANVLNKALVQHSIQPVNAETFDAAGKLAFEEMGLTAGFIKRAQKDKGFAKAFLEKHRMSLNELRESLLARGVGDVERRAVPLLKNLQGQVMQNVETDDLIRILKDNNVAVRYDAKIHGNAGDFVKIDQGRFAAEPLAIPKQWASVISKVLDAMMPSQNTPVLGQFMRDVLPLKAQDFGLIAWWKLTAIFGANPGAYWARNIATGVHKNLIEGLTPATTGTGLGNFLSYWGTGTRLTGEWARHGRPVSEKVLTLPRSGVRVDEERLRQMYRGMNMHGGGLPDVDVIERTDSFGAELRRRYFEHAFGNVAGAPVSLRTGQDASEHFMRVPLMLKILDDTFVAAKEAGSRLPQIVGRLDEAAEDLLLKRHAGSMASYKYVLEEGVGNINVRPALPVEPFEENAGLIQAAFENSREAVIRAHFDYTDLSPIEKRLRAGWIPFYTWMRKNLPAESRNMFTNFGQYMPWVRAYYRAFETMDLTPEDLPEWSQKLFATPVHNEERNTVKFLDLTGFLPFMDVFELGSAAFGEPRHGGSRLNETMAWGLNNANPILTTGFELGFQKDLFTQRQFQGDLPKDFLGLPVNQNTYQLLQNFRPLTDIDRLNPPVPGVTGGRGAFTSLGGALKTFRTTEDRRPGRNEPGAPARLGRFLTGVPLREADRKNLSRIQFRKLNTLRARIRRAEKEGKLALARKLRGDLEKLEK